MQVQPTGACVALLYVEGAQGHIVYITIYT